MTGSGAYELLSDIRDYFSVFPAKIILNENMPIREDTTDFDHYNKIVCNIGVKEIPERPDTQMLGLHGLDSELDQFTKRAKEASILAGRVQDSVKPDDFEFR